jgi:hypothetical protein
MKRRADDIRNSISLRGGRFDLESNELVALALQRQLRSNFSVQGD